MKALSVLATLLIFVAGTAIGAESTCTLPGKSIRVFGPRLTILQLERMGVAFAAENPAQPQVPFSTANKAWLALKRAARPGDFVQSYDGPRLGGGRPLAGGYVLMRGPCAVARLTLWVS